MQRFGRSAQQKLKDRWGGSFILATVLALLGAWFAGQWLNKTLTADKGKETPPSVTQTQNPGTTGSGTTTSALGPGSFNLHLVQVSSVRSEANARRLADKLNMQGYAAIVSPRQADGNFKVYAGMALSAQDAEEIKRDVAASGMVEGAWTKTVSIRYNDAIPVMAQAAGKANEMKAGLETLNVYIAEAARWVENPTANVSTIVSKGQKLAEIGTALNMLAKDSPAMENWAKIAMTASANATKIQNAAKTAPGSPEQMAAMTEFLALVDQYQVLQTQMGASN